MPKWTDIHFRVNKAFWKHYGDDAALAFRILNLQNLQCELEKKNIKVGLFGRTLLDAVTVGRLLSDHDDDLIVHTDGSQNSIDQFLSTANSIGFTVVRTMGNMYSLERFNRYIDVHFVEGSAMVQKELRLNGTNLPVPADFHSILSDKYGADYANFRKRQNSVTNLARRGIKRLKREWALDRGKTIKLVRRHSLPLARKFAKAATKKFKFNKPAYQLSESEFLNLKIDADGAVNWSWRGDHVRMVCEPGETFGQAKERLKKTKILENYKKIVEEVDTSLPFNDPMNMSVRFWQTGNNLFLYPLVFGFRHGILPYHAANLYINENIKPMLYSAEYFEACPKMTDQEIENFLAENPLEITDGALTSGRHRATAMLGRMLRGESYIPVHVYKRW